MRRSGLAATLLLMAGLPAAPQDLASFGKSVTVRTLAGDPIFHADEPGAGPQAAQ